tara:strand:+ start:675 stop:872 length:198 start_codon:yes stop_codon:yes gene_type:complete
MDIYVAGEDYLVLEMAILSWTALGILAIEIAIVEVTSQCGQAAAANLIEKLHSGVLRTRLDQAYI